METYTVFFGDWVAHTHVHTNTHTHHDPPPIIMLVDILFTVSMANEKEARGEERGRRKERGSGRIREETSRGDRKGENR